MRRIPLILFLFVAGLIRPMSASADITTGLMAHWPFSGNAQDASGNGNHGTVMGAQLTTDRMGSPNSAYLFDGLSSRIDVPHSSSLSQPTTAITLAAWIRRDGWGMVGTLYSPILTKSISLTNAFQYRLITTQSGLSTAFNSWNESSGISYTFDEDVWYHVATTWEADSMRSYVDGVLQQTVYFPVTITPDTRTLSIGSDLPGVLEIFYGTIDDVRIYDRALSPSDVAELAGVTVSTPLPALDSRAVTLGRAYPNPMHPTAVIPFSLRARTTVTLEVIDIGGRRVRTLIEGRDMPVGLHSMRWDGRDASGLPVKSGVYMYRLTTPEGRQANKIFVQR